MATRATRDETVLAVFREELRESCSAMIDALVRLEGNPESIEVHAREFLRVAHGLKGAAFAAGLPITGAFVHDLETCLTRLRDGVVDQDVLALEVVYDAVDAIEGLVATECLDTRALAPSVTEAANALAAKYEVVLGARLDALAARAPEALEAADAETSTVRVAVAKLDGVLETAAELVAARAAWDMRASRAEAITEASAALERRLGDISSLLRVAETSQKRELIARIRRGLDECVDVSRRLAIQAADFDDLLRVQRQSDNVALERLQSDARSMRLVRVGTAFASFARMTRDTAASLGRLVDITLEGADTEIDRDLLDTVRDAVAHLVRNAVVHGIESPEDRVALGKPERGRIVVIASTHGRVARIEVQDDGRGVEIEAVRERALALGLLTAAEATALDAASAGTMLFTPGFSTATEVSEVAGRGVGLDAVHATAVRLGGRVSVHSEPGKGARFVLELPVSRAALELLLVDAGNETYAIPSAALDRIIRTARGEARRGHRGLAVEVDGRPVRIFHLADIVGGKSDPLDDVQRPALLLRRDDSAAAFVVDRIVEHRQCLTKGVGDHLEHLTLVQGTTVLSDGRVVPILDPTGLLTSALEEGADIQIASEESTKSVARRVLVVDDSITTRTLQKGILEAAGYEVVVATNGLEALERLALGGVELVLSDIEMPRMDGIELTQKIKADSRYKALPVVVVSSLSKPEERERGLHAGADAYIVKGEFEQGVLLETLRRLL